MFVVFGYSVGGGMVVGCVVVYFEWCCVFVIVVV